MVPILSGAAIEGAQDDAFELKQYPSPHVMDGIHKAVRDFIEYGGARLN